MKPYLYLLFDVDNTLLDFNRGERLAFEQALASFGIEIRPCYYPLYHEANDALWKAYERREIAKERIYTDRFADFSRKAKLTLPCEEVERIYRDKLSTMALPIEGSAALLQDLKQAGYRLFLVTNGDERVQLSRLKKSGLSPFFEAVFVSEAVGHAKPSPLFFDAVENAIDGFDRSRALVIGDSETSDILGANRADIDCCHIRFGGKTLSDLVHATYEIESLNDLRHILL